MEINFKKNTSDDIFLELMIKDFEYAGVHYEKIEQEDSVVLKLNI